MVTANGGTSVYGRSPANPGLSASGLQNGETVSVLTGLENAFGIAPTSGVGGDPYRLYVTGTLSNANYSISARNAGSWIITPAPLMVTADAQSKMFTDMDPALTFRITVGDRPEPTIRVELTKPSGSAAQFAVVNGM